MLARPWNWLPDDCWFPRNSGTPAVIAGSRGALLLSCTQASVAELRRQTLASDDSEASTDDRLTLASSSDRERADVVVRHDRGSS
jgi:hypothetical protein